MTSPHCRLRQVILALGLVLLGTRDLSAYLKFGVSAGNRVVVLKWSRTPVRYFVLDRAVPGVDAAAFQGAVGRGFRTWESVPTASITYQFAGFTSAEPGAQDGISTIGFQSAPEQDRVLAATSFFVDAVSGELIESDIFFNTTFAWSVASSGEADRFDLESIAVHEIGHLSGLGHSMIGETEMLPTGRRRVLAAETVMFPFAYGPANTQMRTLRADDVAGISDLYPDGGFLDDTGTISGRVTKNGRGVFGAHVLAFSPATGQLISNFSLSSRGDFSIAGLSPGPCVIRVEPIDDAPVDSFFDATDNVDVDFRTTYYERLVAVPRGGDSGAIEITVGPR
jgi:hypothetical protein